MHLPRGHQWRFDGKRPTDGKRLEDDRPFLTSAPGFLTFAAIFLTSADVFLTSVDVLLTSYEVTCSPLQQNRSGGGAYCSDSTKQNKVRVSP